jgi:hypothetical protein
VIDNTGRAFMGREKDQREKNRERRFGLGRRIRAERRVAKAAAAKERRSGEQRRKGGNRRSGQDRRRDGRLGSAEHKRLP